jgi:L,D-peptidoglycan transpeptidase YkuD (ErfK/YbiS/YcfS/YnhG family)
MRGSDPLRQCASARASAGERRASGGEGKSRRSASVAIPRLVAALIAAAATMLTAAGQARAAAGVDTGLRAIPRASRELVAVTAPRASATTGTLTAEVRSAPGARWHRVLGPWPAELGRHGLSAHRHEGDGTTPLGIFAIMPTLYGNAPRPRGVRERYRRLRCGEWWDEDPASRRYNRFVALPCGVIPSFAARSEALWTEKVAYPYFAVIGFNTDPIRRGRRAPGSGIFLHSWTDAPTAGCVAIHRSRLLSLLRWLAPARHPVIAISVGA